MREETTHETPIPDSEESGVGVEWYIRPWTFGIMEWAGSLDLGGGEAAANDLRWGQFGTVCGLGKHLSSQ